MTVTTAPPLLKKLRNLGLSPEEETPASALPSTLLPPAVLYCPYCGSSAIREVGDATRRDACRAVFFVRFSRYIRCSPSENP